jgi:dihydroxyacetone kinase-like protein
MGVALTSCTIPASGKAIFDLPEDEIEMGLGLHGEPGQTRTKLLPADQIASQLVSRIVADLSPRHGDEVAVLLNGLGATPVCELFIMFREVKKCLDSLGLSICRSYVGNYATSLDMAGCSVSILKLDSELKRLLLAPANSPAFVQI